MSEPIPGERERWGWGIHALCDLTEGGRQSLLFGQSDPVSLWAALTTQLAA